MSKAIRYEFRNELKPLNMARQPGDLLWITLKDYVAIQSNWNRCDTKADRKVCRNINKLKANRHMVKLKSYL